MKKLSLVIPLFLLAAVSLAFLRPGPAVAARGAEKTEATAQSILVKLDHFTDDLHAAFMAIKLAGGLAKQGAAVTLFVNLEAARVADTRQPQDMTWGHSGPFSDYYDAFIEDGGRVLVCPHCADAAGVDADHLRPGAVIADEQQVMGAILKADKILDY
jgi:predicted peroxiredoxin